MYLNVHSYLTKSLDECRYEGHREMIDVQYMICGGEVVQWALKSRLTEDGEYSIDQDFQYYLRPTIPCNTKVHLTAGNFSIFFPEDAHCPQIHDGLHDSVFKAVVKIHRSLIA